MKWQPSWLDNLPHVHQDNISQAWHINTLSNHIPTSTILFYDLSKTSANHVHVHYRPCPLCQKVNIWSVKMFYTSSVLGPVPIKDMTWRLWIRSARSGQASLLAFWTCHIKCLIQANEEIMLWCLRYFVIIIDLLSSALCALIYISPWHWPP